MSKKQNEIKIELQAPTMTLEEREKYLAELAQGIWLTGARRRKIKLWNSEIKSLLTSIDRQLAKQEDELIIAIKRGFLDQNTFHESNSFIDDKRIDIRQWLMQIQKWANSDNSEILIEDKKEIENDE